MTLYGFVLGRAGDITASFTSNPRPSKVTWKLDNETELQVELFNSHSIDPLWRFKVFELKNTVIICIYPPVSSAHQLH